MLPVIELRPGMKMRVKKVTYKEFSSEKKVRYETVTVIRQYSHHVLVANGAGSRRCITNAEVYTEMYRREEQKCGTAVLRNKEARGIDAGGRERNFPEYLR